MNRTRTASPAWSLVFGLLVLCTSVRDTFGQFGRQPPTVITNARVVLPNGEVLENAGIILRGDRIVAVGTDLDFGDNKPTDVGGATITPGLIDVSSRLGLGSAARGGNAQRRAADDFDPYHRELEIAWRHGVTTVQVSSRSGASVAGRDSVMQLTKGRGNAIGSTMVEDAALTIDLNSSADPVARLNTFDAIVRAFKKAEDYRESVETYDEELEAYEKKIKERAAKAEKEGDTDDGESDSDEADAKPGLQVPPPGRRRPPANNDSDDGEKKDEKEEEIKKPGKPNTDRVSDILLQAIDRELPVRVLAHHSADILNAIELADMYGLAITIVGGAEAHFVANELAEADVPVIFETMERSGGWSGGATGRMSDQAAAKLEAAGVAWYVGTAQASARSLLITAQLMCAGTDVDPIHKLTVDAAKLLGMDDHGAIARGKAADLVIWNGDPADPATTIREVWVAGRRVYKMKKESAS